MSDQTPIMPTYPVTPADAAKISVRPRLRPRPIASTEPGMPAADAQVPPVPPVPSIPFVQPIVTPAVTDVLATISMPEDADGAGDRVARTDGNVAPTDKKPAKAKAAKGDYTVGKNRPPKDGQFKKGKSGNPNGRPKGSVNMETAFKNAFLTKRRVKANGKFVRMSPLEMSLHQLANKAAGGDQRASSKALDIAMSYDRMHSDQQQAAAKANTSFENDAVALDEQELAFLARMQSDRLRDSGIEDPVALLKALGMHAEQPVVDHNDLVDDGPQGNIEHDDVEEEEVRPLRRLAPGEDYG